MNELGCKFCKKKKISICSTSCSWIGDLYNWYFSSIIVYKVILKISKIKAVHFSMNIYTFFYIRRLQPK